MYLEYIGNKFSSSEIINDISCMLSKYYYREIQYDKLKKNEFYNFIDYITNM